MKLGNHRLLALALSPDGSVLAYSDNSGAGIQFCDPRTGKSKLRGIEVNSVSDGRGCLAQRQTAGTQGLS